MEETRKFSVGTVTRFYIPLMLQAFAQSLTYPLVTGIVCHGKNGVDALAAFCQGMSIMFMIGALGAGLITTGMVFAKTCYGYRSFLRLNTIMMAVLLSLQCVPALPPFNDWVFRGFFALSPELAEIARDTLLYGVIMNAGFFLRNVPMVLLFNNYASAKANYATLLRIVFTMFLSFTFPQFGWTGPGWGLVAITLGVWVELLMTYLYARKYAAELSVGVEGLSGRALVSLTWEQFCFTLPLAFGGFLLATSPLICAAYIARSANPADMLAIHYVTLGVANPVCFGALRMQPVAVKFLPEYPGDKRLLYYAIGAGAVLSLGSLAFATPELTRLYFGGYQNVPERLFPQVRSVVALYSLLPIVHAVRGRIEGIAAALKSPRAVMNGQIAYTAAIFLILALLLPLGVAGYKMAAAAVFLSPFFTIAAVYLTLGRQRLTLKV